MRFTTIFAIFAVVASPALSMAVKDGDSQPGMVMPVGESNDTAAHQDEPVSHFGQNRGYAAHMNDHHKMGNNHLRLKQAKRAEVVERALHPRDGASRPSASPRPFK